jgi:signal transduction histidine kinase
LLKAYMALLLISGMVAWWLVLAHKSRQVAQEESNRQTHLLMREIELHRQTDEALQRASCRGAEQARQAADQANQAKSRYISAISHELRTPLNSILGYAQLLGETPAMPAHRKQAVSVIRRGGDHLLSLIEGTLDIARIESGKLTLDVRPCTLPTPGARDGAACSSCRRGQGPGLPARAVGRHCPRWCAPTRSGCARS